MENENTQPQSCDYIRECNLYDAIDIAIRERKLVEEKISPKYKSTFRAGLESNLKALQEGKPLRIVP